MTGFEPATPRPPGVCANRTAPHPDMYGLNLPKKHSSGFKLNLKLKSMQFIRSLAKGHIPKLDCKNRNKDGIKND